MRIAPSTHHGYRLTQEEVTIKYMTFLARFVVLLLFPPNAIPTLTAFLDQNRASRLAGGNE